MKSITQNNENDKKVFSSIIKFFKTYKVSSIDRQGFYLDALTGTTRVIKSFKSTCCTIISIEAIQMIHKGQAGTSNGTKEVALINQLVGVA